MFVGAGGGGGSRIMTILFLSKEISTSLFSGYYMIVIG